MSNADGSLIAAEGAIANVVGMTQMNPPVKDLCECALLRSIMDADMQCRE